MLRLIENPDFIHVDQRKLLHNKIDEVTDLLQYTIHEDILTRKQYNILYNAYYRARFGGSPDPRTEVRSIKFYLSSMLTETYVNKIKRSILDMIDLAEQTTHKDRSHLSYIECGPEESESMKQIRRNMRTYGKRQAKLKKHYNTAKPKSRK